MGQALRLASKANDGRKNFIINGVGPFVNQEGNKTGPSSNSYIADIFRYINTGASVANTGVGFAGGSEYIYHDTTTADTSIAAGDAVVIDALIEGYDAEPLELGTANAKTVTLSFKHRHSKTGIYCVGLKNAADNRSYVFEYTQSVSDAEETHTETIQLDTTGTWAIDNTAGLIVRFAVSIGTNYQTTADSWQSGDFIATANQVNGVDTVGNSFRIRDIQLEIGEVATDPEYIPFENKIAQVRRRYFSTYAYGVAGGSSSVPLDGTVSAAAINGSFVRVRVGFPSVMRVIPSLAVYSPITGASGKARNVDDNTDINAGATATATGATAGFNDATLATGKYLALHLVADARL